MTDQPPVLPSSPGVPGSLAAQVLHDGRVDAEDERVMLAALAACGVEAQVKIVPVRRDAQALTWLMLISLPLQAFISTMGQKAAADAYHRFISAAGRLLDRGRRPAPGPAPVLALQDPGTGVRVILEPGLPRAAFEQLCALDLARYRYGPLHYDRAEGRWRSELDEASSTHPGS